MNSIRLNIGRWSEGTERLVQHVAERLRHIVVEPKPGHDCTLSLLLTFPVDSDAIGAKRDEMQGAKEAAADDGVDDALVAISQVYKNSLVGHERFSQVPRYWGLQEKAHPTVESTA